MHSVSKNVNNAMARLETKLAILFAIFSLKLKMREQRHVYLRKTAMKVEKMSRLKAVLNRILYIFYTFMMQ